VHAAGAAEVQDAARWQGVDYVQGRGGKPQRRLDVKLTVEGEVGSDIVVVATCAHAIKMMYSHLRVYVDHNGIIIEVDESAAQVVSDWWTQSCEQSRVISETKVRRRNRLADMRGENAMLRARNLELACEVAELRDAAASRKGG
jgi:hypothetical protein